MAEQVIQTLPFYNKNTSSTKVYDQGATAKGSLYFKLLGASFFLIELLCYNTSACVVYDTLGKLQDSTIQKTNTERLYFVHEFFIGKFPVNDA